ncbi:unnamed protein product [Trichogramma brassicae]|uniref:Uncharacterized protein n=1 Tax=Trichogramma brassicae TaxID=86971 RepID=A0A6H5IB33_9HYME|nr:unnamed protein product [Trichogramma brassicae]
MTGPTIQAKLFEHLIRFRTYKYAITADIAQMYRQILIHPDDPGNALASIRQLSSDGENQCSMCAFISQLRRAHVFFRKFNLILRFAASVYKRTDFRITALRSPTMECNGMKFGTVVHSINAEISTEPILKIRFRKKTHYKSIQDFSEHLVKNPELLTIKHGADESSISAHLLTSSSNSHHIILYDSDLVAEFDNNNDMFADATFKVSPDINGVTQVLTIMCKKYSTKVEQHIYIQRDRRETLGLKQLQNGDRVLSHLEIEKIAVALLHQSVIGEARTPLISIPCSSSSLSTRKLGSFSGRTNNYLESYHRTLNQDMRAKPFTSAFIADIRTEKTDSEKNDSEKIDSEKNVSEKIDSEKNDLEKIDSESVDSDNENSDDLEDFEYLSNNNLKELSISTFLSAFEAPMKNQNMLGQMQTTIIFLIQKTLTKPKTLKQYRSINYQSSMDMLRCIAASIPKPIVEMMDKINKKIFHAQIRQDSNKYVLYYRLLTSLARALVLALVQQKLRTMRRRASSLVRVLLWPNNPTCFLFASEYIRREHESCRLYCIFTTCIDHSLCKCVVCCKRIVYVTSNAKRTRESRGKISIARGLLDDDDATLAVYIIREIIIARETLDARIICSSSREHCCSSSSSSIDGSNVISKLK